MPGLFNPQLAFPVVLVTFTALSLGYDVGVMSAARKPLMRHYALDPLRTGLMMGVVNVLAAPLALLGSRMADMLGRVPGTIVTAIALFTGPLIVSVSESFGVLMFGRVVIGIGVGFAMVIPPVYAAELAPPEYRGRLVSLTEILINAGIVIGYFSAFLLQVRGLSEDMGWRLACGLAAVPPMIVLLCSLPPLFGIWTERPLIPESPRWLASHRRWSEAEAVVQSVYTDPAEVTSAWRSLKDSMQEQTEEASWSAIFCPIPAVRRMLFAGVGIAFFQQACGSDTLVYYSPLILEEAGVGGVADGNCATMLIGLTKFVGACLGGYFLDLVGRRPAVLLSSAGCGLCLALIIAVLHRHDGFVAGVIMCAFMLLFELGLGPAAYVVGTESYPMAIRTKAMSTGMFASRLVSGLVTMTLPAMVSAWTLPGTLGAYSFASFVGLFWMWCFVPETKGLALEEVTQLYEKPWTEPLSGSGQMALEYGTTSA